MNYSELRDAVYSAYRQCDYDLCFSLLDEFIEGSSGTDRGKALCLKASVILWRNDRRAPEGLYLVDEALDCCKADPGESMRSVINALALCYVLGDVHKAHKYEALGTRLLQTHGTDLTVSEYRYRLHGNLGKIASLRGEHASAYWHGMQALAYLRELGICEGLDRQCVYVAFSLDVVDAALKLGRVPEAEETLAGAQPFATTPTCIASWTIQRAKIWRYTGRNAEAETVLAQLDPGTLHKSPPAEQSRFHLITAQLAQDRGDWPTYHQHLAQAQRLAVDHPLEYVLSEIQRVQRTPLNMGVMS